MNTVLGVDPLLKDQLASLCAEFNSKRDDLLKACGGSHESLVFEASDLDLGALLVQILPILLSMMNGGFDVSAILGVVKLLLPMFIKNAALADVLYKILEALISVISKK